MKKIREYLEEHGTAIRKFSGLAVSVLTVLALVGCLSYLFTWKQDQSLLAAQEVAESANLAGKAGMSLSALLVGRWFGLGAFAVVFAMIILSVRLLFGKRKFPVVKNIVLSITGAVLLSFFLAFFSFRFGLENVLGGGLGGECGAVAVIWLENMVGGIITFFILCVLLVIWMFFTSRRFSDWFKGDLAISEKKDSPDVEKKPRRTFTFLAKDPEEKEEAETEAEEKPESPVSQPVAEHVAEPVEEPVSQPVSKTVSSPAPRPVHPQPSPAPAKNPSEDVQIIESAGLTTDVQEELPRIDVRDELENYKFPTLDLLSDYADAIHNVPQQEIMRNNYKSAQLSRHIKSA